MMTILKKALTIILESLLYILIACGMLFQSHKGFSDKNRIIHTVKNNLNELNDFTTMLINEYDDKDTIIINKDAVLKFNSEIKHNDEVYKKIFNKFNLDSVMINSSTDKNKIVFETLKNYNATYCGFYYSRDDNKCLRETTNYITNDNWTVHFFQQKSGWYTEKICDNWYYYEEDWDYLYFINYIKDDLKQMKEYEEIHERFKKYFDD